MFNKIIKVHKKNKSNILTNTILEVVDYEQLYLQINLFFQVFECSIYVHLKVSFFVANDKENDHFVNNKLYITSNRNLTFIEYSILNISYDPNKRIIIASICEFVVINVLYLKTIE